MERALRPVSDRWRARGPLTQDIILALTLAAAAFLPGLAANGIALGLLPRRPLDGWGVFLGLAQCLPLVLRRRRPVLCLALVAAAFSVDQLIGYPPSFGSEGLVVALYSTGSRGGRHRTAAAVTASTAYAVLALALRLRGSPERPMDFVTFWMVLAGCWAAGAWIRGRQAREEERRLHSAQLAVAEERARIARELHDVVTHHVTAMVVQSDAAQFLLPDSPDRATEGLAAIGRTGRRALVELRCLLDVLDTPTGRGPAPTGPVPGNPADLVEATRAAGQPVEFVEEGEPRAEHGGLTAAAYRVVQEALTNAVKHAPGRPTEVRIRYDADGIEIDVSNEGALTTPAPQPAPTSAHAHASTPAPTSAHAHAPASTPTPAGGGRGLAGLRERVAVLDGELTAGPRPGGGFRLHTRLPLGQDR
ncbi:hypothetical protein WN71_037715 [Streptomyces mangrovisoli]|uniref:histidine kinase n=1 Tax=Streptomyces mangrovisoli TaxID=1428628 RepID=A0A1J4NMD1_9ACTN|nr:hypothetical protein WN71_037715 [Streptomyces mangrovisoli]